MAWNVNVSNLKKVSSIEEKELQSVKITAKQLFAGKKPHGRGASYLLNLTDLWYTPLEIFDAEVEKWNAQRQPARGLGKGSGSVGAAAQRSGEQADGEEHETCTDEEEGSDVDDDFQNGAVANERLQGTRDELAITTIAFASVLPSTVTHVQSRTATATYTCVPSMNNQ